MRIKCVETGKIYESVREAERCTGICRTSIQNVINGKSKRANGYHWEKARTGKPKKVLCIDTGEIFDSILAAERASKSDHVGDCCRGTRKTSAGMCWKFICD